ncbi:hypothetical protein TNIN_159481 [Trichonephila inaurata madagascariensis]|uniref:C2H2-type domain-containing protein n=1 Tax=Trichonephila inaurata madagascariensis TaxID=2747483 RepID=A0A8X6I3E0_9ARAC|nr:hypothetical protein TNIN_159481 [Trichonephila inaurata madagascariensis]
MAEKEIKVFECLCCNQEYKTAKELFIHEFLHFDNVEPFNVFQLRKLPPKGKPILEDFRTENGIFYFPISKPLKRKIAKVENFSKSPRSIENATSSHSILLSNFKKSRNQNEGLHGIYDIRIKVNPSSRDSGNETDNSSTSESNQERGSDKIYHKRLCHGLENEFRTEEFNLRKC